MKSYLSYTETRIRFLFWALALSLGFLQSWASRTTVVNDTVSYLDIGDSIWGGHWSIAVNGLWNPLYSAILGVAIGLFRPSFYWEYPLVHLVLLLIFAFTLWSYDFFLRQLILLRRETESKDEFSVPTWIWFSIGYTLFLWCSLRLIGVSETNPDMLVAAFFFLSCGLLVKIRLGTAGWPAYCGLGLALGLGYLTKSIMFPVSIACLAAAFVIGRSQVRRVLASVALFLIVSVPYVITLSVVKGRITFGDSGTYNYAVHVDNIPGVHWQGGPGKTADGQPLHPSRQLVTEPATFEFGSPIGGTYPAWTDPTYWYEGLRPHLSLHRTISTEAHNLEDEFLSLFDLHGSIIAGIFVMLYASGRKWSVLKDIARYWFLIFPCLATLGMYAMIHIEPRYLGPFLIILLISLFLSARLPASESSRGLCSAIAVSLLVMYFLPFGSSSLNVRGFVSDILGRSHPDPDSPAEVVKGMYGLGMKPDDKIASLQWSLFGTSTWARLARVKIVAEVYYWPERPATFGNDFWTADSAAQERVIQALARTSATFIVSQLPPTVPDMSGWQRVGNTHYYAYRIQPVSALSSEK
jgi:hypothetical protein